MAGAGRRLHLASGEYIADGSILHRSPELADASVVSLLYPTVEETAELLFGRVRLAAGRALPLHSHPCAETVYILEGHVRLQLGRAIAEFAAPGAAYFPPGIPHTIEALGGRDATFLLCYPQGKESGNLETLIVEPGVDQSDWPNPNAIASKNPLHRWALVDDFEPLVPFEPTKGWNLAVRYLLDPKRGAPDVTVGTSVQKPNVHYTAHRHEPPELYYVLSGEGVVHVAGESVEVRAGSSVYVPSGATHAIDTFDSSLEIYWVYGLDSCGPDWVWEPVEPIYNAPISGTTV